MSRLRFLAPASALLVMGAFHATASAATEHVIVVERMQYRGVPKSVEVGDVIRWVNRDAVRHTATARDGSFNLDLPPKSSARVTIRKPGRISFHCIPHPGMKGTLNVSG